MTGHWVKRKEKRRLEKEQKRDSFPYPRIEENWKMNGSVRVKAWKRRRWQMIPKITNFSYVGSPNALAQEIHCLFLWLSQEIQSNPFHLCTKLVRKDLSHCHHLSLSNHSNLEGKEREGKGREGKGREESTYKSSIEKTSYKVKEQQTIIQS